jgi:hypothetical protein
MMGRLDKQVRIVYIYMSSIVPDNHLLRIIKENIDFEFIYDRVSDELIDRIEREVIYFSLHISPCILKSVRIVVS